MAVAEREINSGAFSIEYEKNVPDKALYDDVVSYLGEYRLQVQKFNYDLQFSGSTLLDMYLRDANQGEPMYIKAKRSIEKRKKKGYPTHREEAELSALGDPDNLKRESLGYQLRLAKDGDMVMWGSPPGPKSEDYGNYGFIFKGTVRVISPLEKRATMTAIRVENPTLAQYNAAFSDLLGREINFSHEDEFLAHPFIKYESLEEADLDRTLRNNFSFDVDSGSQTLFKRVIKQLESSIQEFIVLTKKGTKEEKQKAFYALENYALELKERYEKDKNEAIVYLDEKRPLPLAKLTALFGHQPPEVAGSCGLSRKAKSNNILSNGYQTLMTVLFGEIEFFECVCGWKADKEIGEDGACGGCGLTKKTAAEKGIKVC